MAARGGLGENENGEDVWIHCFAHALHNSAIELLKACKVNPKDRVFDEEEDEFDENDEIEFDASEEQGTHAVTLVSTIF